MLSCLPMGRQLTMRVEVMEEKLETMTPLFQSTMRESSPMDTKLVPNRVNTYRTVNLCALLVWEKVVKF